jgi:hypothetical protein
MLTVLVVCVAAAIAVVAVMTRNDHRATAPSPTPPVTAASSVPSAAPSSAPQQSASSSASTKPFELGYQPLYPFASRAEALAWEQSHRSGGHQPWHADAKMTAQAFTSGYLGFTEIDLVTSSVTDSRGAHIGVGYRNPNGTLQTAAVLHLVRYGPESDAPWEVVGSDDTTFSLEVPAYGSTVSSPVTVGGHITGIDENIRVTVRQLGSQAALGESSGIPAGGSNQPWSTSVAFSPPSGATLIIVARTGGHLQEVERFAIQGVRV